jgi:sec-independent protein translocase protein TatA
MRRFPKMSRPAWVRRLAGVIGLPEILVLIVLVVIIFGYKRLPQLGRSAGQSLRTGVDKAKELGNSVGDKVDGKVDPSDIGRSAGKGLREAREFRDALTGKETPKPKAPPAPAPAATPPAAPAPPADEPQSGAAPESDA